MCAGTCVAPNTGVTCRSHDFCTGAKGGPQRCLRPDKPITVYATILGTGVSFVNQKLTGKVIGLTSPYPPTFVVRAISETTSEPGAENELTVSLVANFPLQQVDKTIVTLSGLRSSTPSQACCYHVGLV